MFSLQRTEGRRSLRHSETPGHGPPSALFKYVDYLSGSGDRIVGRRAAAALQAAAAGATADVTAGRGLILRVPSLGTSVPSLGT